MREIQNMADHTNVYKNIVLYIMGLTNFHAEITSVGLPAAVTSVRF